jgi:hypothetical protein
MEIYDDEQDGQDEYGASDSISADGNSHDLEISRFVGHRKTSQRVVCISLSSVLLVCLLLASDRSCKLRYHPSQVEVGSRSVFVTMEQLYQLPFDRYSPRDKQR